MSVFLRLLILGSVVLLGGCFQASSENDDDLHTVPVTNNPNLIMDSNRNTAMPGMGY